MFRDRQVRHSNNIGRAHNPQSTGLLPASHSSTDVHRPRTSTTQKVATQKESDKDALHSNSNFIPDHVPTQSGDLHTRPKSADVAAAVPTASSEPTKSTSASRMHTPTSIPYLSSSSAFSPTLLPSSNTNTATPLASSKETSSSNQSPRPHLSPVAIAVLCLGVLVVIFLSCFAFKWAFRIRKLRQSENNVHGRTSDAQDSPLWGGRERTGRTPTASWTWAPFPDPSSLDSNQAPTNSTIGPNYAGFGRGGEWSKMSPTPRQHDDNDKSSAEGRMSDTSAESLVLSDPENAVIQTASRTSLYPGFVSSTSIGSRIYEKTPVALMRQNNEDQDLQRKQPLKPAPKLTVINASPPTSSPSLDTMQKGHKLGLEGLNPADSLCHDFDDMGSVPSTSGARLAITSGQKRWSRPVQTPAIPHGTYHKTGKIGLGFGNYSANIPKPTSGKSIITNSTVTKLTPSNSNEHSLLYPLPSFLVPPTKSRTDRAAGDLHDPKLDRDTKILTSALGLTSPPTPIVDVKAAGTQVPTFVCAVTEPEGEMAESHSDLAYTGITPLSPANLAYTRSDSQSPQTTLGKMMLKDYDTPGGIASPSLPYLGKFATTEPLRKVERSKTKPLGKSTKVNRLVNDSTPSALATAVANARSAQMQHGIEPNTKHGHGNTKPPKIPALSHLSNLPPQQLPSLKQMTLLKNDMEYRSPTYSIYGLYEEAAAAVADGRSTTRKSWSGKPV